MNSSKIVRKSVLTKFHSGTSYICKSKTTISTLSTNDDMNTSTRSSLSRNSCRSIHTNNDDTRSLLMLSSTLLPEPNASAAGVRTASILNHFADITTSNNNTSTHDLSFHSVHYGCGIPLPEKIPSHNDMDIKYPNLKHVSFHHIPPNRETTMKHFLLEDPIMSNLQVVIFDRFFSEEAYSFHFHRYKPNVLRVLDMQDMHSLRAHRQSIVENESGSEKSSSLLSSIPKVVSSYPRLKQMKDDHHHAKKGKKDVNSTLLRELASIHRSDLTLVCSPYELSLLRDEYGIPSHKLALASFFIESSDVSNNNNDTSTTFHERKDFVTLGGFKHPPNIDQVKVLKYDIWPKILKEIPNANLYVYGAYPHQSISKLHDERNGFHIKGYAESLEEILSSSKVMLAPLRYGAGIKGKIIDSWRFGCPVVTTPIGSEGMTDDNDDQWGGSIAFDSDGFVQSAIDIYTNESKWTSSQRKGTDLLERLFNAETNFRDLNANMSNAMQNLQERRERDYVSAMLWQQQTRSTEYFSKWIEQKELSRSK